MRDLRPNQRAIIWVAILVGLAFFVYPPVGTPSTYGRNEWYGYVFVLDPAMRQKVTDWPHLLFQYAILGFVTWFLVSSVGKDSKIRSADQRYARPTFTTVVAWVVVMVYSIVSMFATAAVVFGLGLKLPLGEVAIGNGVSALTSFLVISAASPFAFCFTFVRFAPSRRRTAAFIAGLVMFASVLAAQISTGNITPAVLALVALGAFIGGPVAIKMYPEDPESSSTSLPETPTQSTTSFSSAVKQGGWTVEQAGAIVLVMIGALVVLSFGGFVVYMVITGG